MTQLITGQAPIVEPGVIQYTDMKNGGPLAFIRSIKVELDLVKWPTHAQTVRMTAIVIIGSLLVGAYVGGLDIALTNLLTKIVAR